MRERDLWITCGQLKPLGETVWIDASIYLTLRIPAYSVGDVRAKIFHIMLAHGVATRGPNTRAAP